ncbi:Smr/MutS family protein [Chelativorans alearense]|uniref:Smr/MutS family protein n=1 Tax=Chelativorans alearense TaxID=2681495 RepID=UPI0013D37C34|nr:Smr/MutS family protein [Chelativorans alearense]
MKRKRLTDEDRILWSRVARTAVPMKGKAFPDEALEPPPALAGKRQRPLAPAAEPNADMSAGPERHPRRLDAPTREKLAKGRLDIAGRVDLHGMTQEEAHILLLSFLRRAYQADRRYVLVITGKGSSGEGVLRRAVPQWLATPPFRAIVGGYEEAARHHGGGGALYVRLRRAGGGR